MPYTTGSFVESNLFFFPSCFSLTLSGSAETVPSIPGLTFRALGYHPISLAEIRLLANSVQHLKGVNGDQEDTAKPMR